MLERVTALLAQAAATLLVLVGLVAVLGYSHSQAYQAGYCAGRYCPEEQTSWWPFGGNNAAAPANTTANTGRNPGGTVNNPVNPVTVNNSGWTDYRNPDPAPNAGANTGYGVNSGYQNTYQNTPYQGGSGSFPGVGLPVTGGIAGPGATVRPGGSGSIPFFRTDPGERICESNSYSVDESAEARCWLRIGDAYQAIGRIDDARDAWDRSLTVGSHAGGAQAALVAHQRLQAAVLERSCPTTTRSLARIAYGFSQTEDDGDIIDLDLRQRALSALGYYSGDVDGTYGPMTRRSVRDFQGDMGFDQTGALTPSETVTLICHAALTARDSHAQNLLGIMFATGLGLEQNIDTALEWLETAADRGHGGANFNLALIYGTGTVQGSYRMCGLVESPERADSYLRRAADLGHERAQRLRDYAGRRGTPAERWSRISSQLLEEAEANGDRFYLAWQRRVDEVRRQYGEELEQPGCYQAAFDDTDTALAGITSGAGRSGATAEGAGQ